MRQLFRGSSRLRRDFLFALALGLFFLALCLGIGMQQGRLAATCGLVVTSVIFEAQPAAVTSLPLGFGPWTGSAISVLANLIGLPMILVLFPELLRRWRWVRRQLHKAQRRVIRLSPYSVWALVLLAPFLGAYASVVVGYSFGWGRLRSLAATIMGMVASVAVLTFGGHWALILVAHYLADMGRKEY